MTTLVEIMNPNLKCSYPYKGKINKVKEIRKRLVESTRKSCDEYFKNQKASYDTIKNKRIL